MGRVMGSEELRAAAGGISEWARRVRELRDQEGYQILTNNDRSVLKPGQYLLENSKPAPACERAISKETRAKCAVRSPERTTPTTWAERLDSTSATSSTSRWEEKMTLPAYVPSARFAMRAHGT